ncbi:nitroreductase [Hydrogenophaga sp. 5NK40-0174]|uniref:nitroreductase family protein n=1 Tax=Hydrogenophaga sp. 5NK40-0174 TaxID=3127649 RepID=UPI003106FEFD
MDQTNPTHQDVATLVEELLAARRTILPKRLMPPGPGQAELQRILAAAAHAPDHQQLLPWRFILVPDEQRGALGQAFVDALLERDADASVVDQDKARDKATRGPVLMLVAVDECKGEAPDVPLAERIFSAACAVQNMLLASTALGYGSAVTTGKGIGTSAMHRFFQLRPSEQALCFVSVGSVEKSRPGKLRPSVSDYVSRLGEDLEKPQA